MREIREGDDDGLAIAGAREVRERDAAAGPTALHLGTVWVREGGPRGGEEGERVSGVVEGAGPAA